ncbi:MAG: ABC transporter permease [Clostridiales Family XIII bacterium]|jgi:peptide/nickel transport system permease protein|nr:ABC transporter permease [Clostridiales Family XIII bacterium]
MFSYIVRRLLHAVLVTFIVSIIIFLLVRAIPGDPIQMLVSADSFNTYTPEMIEALKEEKGLNGTLVEQYLRWAKDIVRGDFGRSIMNDFEIGPQMWHRIVVTLLIGLTAFVIGCIIGPLLGIISAVRRGKWIDDLVTVFANIGITAPTFWLGILFMYAFAVKLQWLPVYGYTLPWDDFALSFKQSILPVLVTAFLPIASAARQMRSSVLEVLGEDYIRTAWAKGLNERKVLLKHVFKNSLMPVVTLQGNMMRMIVGGSVVVETVFVIPGMGRFLVEAMLEQDYTVVQAVTVVMTVFVVLANLLIDLLYGWIDPRIQYSKGGIA